MKKKQLAWVMVPALAVAMVIGGAAQADLIVPAYGGYGGGSGPTSGNVIFDNTTNRFWGPLAPEVADSGLILTRTEDGEYLVRFVGPADRCVYAPDVVSDQHSLVTEDSFRDP